VPQLMECEGKKAAESSLAREAAVFHRAFFGEAADEVTMQRYEAANQRYLSDNTRREAAAVARVVARHLDVEAVELALRLRNHNNLLSKKVRILFYLAEVRARYVPFFVNYDRRSLGGTVLSLGASLLVTGWKLARGNYLVWRHALV
jgi:hypothetical protein